MHSLSRHTEQTVPAPSDDALRALLDPRSIAIVGASGRDNNPFARPLQYLTEYGFEGGVYPINPNYVTLRGVPCFPDIESVPEPVDLALLLVPGDEAMRQIPRIASAGASAAVVFASGFAEVDNGDAKQAELVETANRHGVRLIGPNCQGVLNVRRKMAATFTPALDGELPRPGNIAYVGQSGAVGGSILSFARERGMGISSWISTGNQADLQPDELGGWLVEQPDIDVLTFYFEKSPDPAGFARLALRAQRLDKRIVVLQSGRSSAGARAAMSHTGAILGSNAAFDAVCEEYGVVRANDLEDFVTVAHALSTLPMRTGANVGVVTTSGGAGSLAADQLEQFGLTVEEFGAETQAVLAARIPDFGTVANPVDVTAQMFRSSATDEFGQVCSDVVDASEVDALMVILTLVTGEFAERMAEELIGVWRRSSKPLVVVWLASTSQTAAARARIRDAGFPVLNSPRQAAEILRALRRRPVGRPTAAPPVTEALRAAVSTVSGPTVPESGVSDLLDVAGVARPVGTVVDTPDGARAVAEQIGGPVVLKIQASSVLHKTEVGGVRLGVEPADAGSVCAELLDRFRDHADAEVLVQPHVPDGPELIVGITRSGPGLAPLVTVGLGGTTTELYADTVTRLGPVDAATARDMLTSLEASPLLTGFRGSTPYDLDLIADAIERLSSIGCAFGDRLTDFEVNPLRVTRSGVLALDALITLDDPERSGPKESSE